jgi:hypothetical protein
VKDPFITLAIVSVLILACGEEEGVTKPAPERLEPTTPAYVLRNVEIAFNQRDINLLKAMLSEDFVFYFDPRDVGGSPPGKPNIIIPESWSYTEHVRASENMFNQAYRIDLSIATSGVGTPGENETTYLAENINLSIIVMVDDLTGFIADNGYCNFEFERYEAPSGKKYWRLINWWDRTSQGYDANPGVSPTSLGRILCLYR